MSALLFLLFPFYTHCYTLVPNDTEVTEIVRYDGRVIPFENKPQKFYYVNISNPDVEIKVRCAHCNAERCRPLPFCYSIQNSNEVRSTGDYCADEAEMYSLVGAQLDATTSSQRKRRRLHESCLPSINDETIHYCVCQTFDDDASSREYDALRRIRIWRYQSLIFHDEVQKKEGSWRMGGLTVVFPLLSVISRLDTFNQDMLERVKISTTRFSSATRSPCFIRWSPVLLALATTVFILFGSTCFYLFERDPHEQTVRKWYMNLAVERRGFAKHISSRIFNDTRNLLIIIDREQTERVQQLLVESLKRYEDKLSITPPSRREWSWTSSFNFAYSLLLTVGAGFKVPSTIGSQIFAVFYCLIGIPLFYSTLGLIVYRLVSPVLKWPSLTRARRFLLILAVFGLFILWTLLIGLCLYYQVLNDFWLSIFNAFTGSLTVQIPSPVHITACGVLFINFAATISVSLLLLILLVSLSVFFPKELLLQDSETAVEEKLERLTPPPKFQVIVDEAGESKLTTA